MKFIDYGYIKASKLGIGTASYGSRVSGRQALKIMSKLEGQGINYIDTANSYGFGESEKIVGQFIHGKRENFFISTKVGIKSTALPFYKKSMLPIARQAHSFPILKKVIYRQSVNANHDQPYISTLYEFKNSIEESLSRLKTEYLDQLLIHNNYSVLDSPDIIEYLKYCREMGIVRNLGITTHFIENPAVREDVLKHQSFIDTLQIPFSAFSIPMPYKLRINFFSVFSSSVEEPQNEKALEIKIINHNKGHFLVAFTTLINIDRSLNLFSK
jgi:aryl-alcohol dehydrogenase-like predicted oxidoreductase